jgi:hypothetical protein
MSAGDIFIAGIFFMSSSVARGGTDNAIEFVKGGLHTPKTTTSKNGFFSLGQGSTGEEKQSNE